MYLYLMKMCIILGDCYYIKCCFCLLNIFFFKIIIIYLELFFSIVKMFGVYFLVNIVNEKKFLGIKYSMFYFIEKNIEVE